MPTSVELVLTALNKIKTITLDETFEDDDLLCAKFVVVTTTNEVFPLEGYWIGWKGVAALEYFNEAPSAKKEVFFILHRILNELEYDIPDVKGPLGDDQIRTIRFFGLTRDSFGQGKIHISSIEEVLDVVNAM